MLKKQIYEPITDLKKGNINNGLVNRNLKNNLSIHCKDSRILVYIHKKSGKLLYLLSFMQQYYQTKIRFFFQIHFLV